jgi:chromosome segregation ATPase
MLEADYSKLLQKALQKRQKEVDKISAKLKQFQGMDEDELADEYGYARITYDEYQAMLKDLQERKEQGQTSIDAPTTLTEYLRMIRRELNSTQCEIQELKEELGAA